MVTHMKTTVEISDHLLRTAKEMARRERTTVRALIEEGLRLAVAQRRRRPRYRMRDASVEGQGLQEGITEGSWEQIRDLIYEGRGG
jgi:hypothetical protein